MEVNLSYFACPALNIKLNSGGRLGTTLGHTAKHAKSGCNICSLLYTATSKFSEHWDGQDEWKVQLRLERGMHQSGFLEVIMQWEKVGISLVRRELKQLTSWLGYRGEIGLVPLEALQVEGWTKSECEPWCTLRFDIYPFKDGQVPPWMVPSSGGEEFALRSSTAGIGRNVPSDPTLDPCFDMVRSWLNECKMEHHECIPDEARAFFMPRKLVAVGSSMAAPHLFEPQGPKCIYTALTHCWGTNKKVPVLKTTRSTAASFSDKIPWGSLSRTFQDAIIITRRLGIAYIWIDSLCIVQDDPNDWAAESVKMASIYREAELVISADAGEDGSKGCLRLRPASHIINASRDDGEPFEVIASSPKWTVHSQFASGKGYNPLFPLTRRGWCLQEKLLAQRILHCTPLEMVWQCNRKTECECRGLNQLSFAADRGTRPRHRGKQGWTTYLFESLPSSRAVLWADVVKSYTERGLTYHSDRLPAMSALARTLAAPEMGRYLAGNWESYLVESLLWSRGSEEHWRSHSFQPPSWSWSAIDCQISVEDPVHPGRVTKAAVIEADCSLVYEQDPYSAVSEGYIVLEGLCVSGTAEIRERGTRYNIGAEQEVLLFMLDDGRYIEDRRVINDSPLRGGPRPIRDGEKLYCLWLTSLATPDSDVVRSQRFNKGAVLRKLTSSEEAYERIGLLSTIGEQGFFSNATKVRLKIV